MTDLVQLRNMRWEGNTVVAEIIEEDDYDASYCVIYDCEAKVYLYNEQGNINSYTFHAKRCLDDLYKAGKRPDKSMAMWY